MQDREGLRDGVRFFFFYKGEIRFKEQEVGQREVGEFLYHNWRRGG